MSKIITYEQPLNERVRTFLRIEYLFDKIEHFVNGDSEWDSRSALSVLIEIGDFLSRSDIKNELVKELERDLNKLISLEKSPGVDHKRLKIVLDEINDCLNSLRDSTFQPGQTLRKNEFITSIKQRNSMPGGSCNFDLPGSYQWLHSPASKKLRDFDEWQQDLQLIKKSIKLSLDMMRNSSNPSLEKAERGFYQKTVESETACQLIRVILPEESTFYPEISGGRQRFTVRFMEYASINDRPSQTEATIDFELHCCNL